MSKDQWIVLGIAVYGALTLFAWCLVASGADPEPRPKRAATPQADDRLPHHRSPDCAGTWRQMEDDPYHAVCIGCRASAYGLVRVGEALAENARGMILRRLTAEGAAMLQRERKGAA